MEEATTIHDLPPGSVFIVREPVDAGIYGVKTEYHYPNGQCQCILLASGEYAHFTRGDNTRVIALDVQEILFRYQELQNDVLRMRHAFRTIARTAQEW